MWDILNIIGGMSVTISIQGYIWPHSPEDRSCDTYPDNYVKKIILFRLQIFHLGAIFITFTFSHFTLLGKVWDILNIIGGMSVTIPIRGYIWPHSPEG